MALMNAMSRLVGRFADTRFPSPVQSLINRAYVRSVGVDLAEFKAVETYRSLNDLFGRRMEKTRSVDVAVDSLIAPCDADISGYGRLQGDSLLQVKGIEYSVRDLLTEHARHVDKVFNGAYISLYLSPRMYHGYHAPATLYVERLIHAPGTLWPVNSFALMRVPGLFAKNERVILECRRLSGQRFWIVFVGATNVGSIRISFEPALVTNKGFRACRVFEYTVARKLTKGTYLGRFLMGSSILLLAESQTPVPGSLGISHVRVGDPLRWPPAS